MTTSKFNGTQLEAIKNELSAEIENFVSTLENVDEIGKSIVTKELWKSPSQEDLSEKWEGFSSDFPYVCGNLRTNLDFLQNAIDSYNAHLIKEQKAVLDNTEALRGSNISIKG